MAMLSEHDLLDSIFQAALKGCDVNVSARKNAIWNACLAMMGDVLRESDQFTRERLLHGLEAELRRGVVELEQLLKPTTRNPFKLN
jgi:hypothetical protein